MIRQEICNNSRTQPIKQHLVTTTAKKGRPKRRSINHPREVEGNYLFGTNHNTTCIRKEVIQEETQLEDTKNKTMKQEKTRSRTEAEKDEDVAVTTTKLDTTSYSSSSFFFTNTTSPIIIKPTHRTAASRYHNKQQLEVVVHPTKFSYHNYNSPGQNLHKLAILT